MTIRFLNIIGCCIVIPTVMMLSNSLPRGANANLCAEEIRDFRDSSTVPADRLIEIRDAILTTSESISVALASTITNRLPNSFLNWISDFKPSDRPRQVRRHIATFISGSPFQRGHRDSLMIFAATFALDSPYMAILERSSLGWNISWDSIGGPSMVLPGIEEIDLGLKLLQLRTYVIGGMNGPAGAYILISWNGSTGKIIGTFFGHGLEPRDLNGDGISEIKMTSGGSKGEPTKSTIYEYDPVRNEYTDRSILKDFNR